MKNAIFEIGFDESKGTLNALSLVGDKEQANFIKPNRGLGEIHDTLWYARGNGVMTKKGEKWELQSFTQSEEKAKAVFSRRGVKATEDFYFTDKDFRIKIVFQNDNAYPVYYKREDISIYTPFADSYDDSLTCQKIRCHAHVAPFMDNSYIRCERMGTSEYNLGLLFLQGAAYSYSQEDCNSNNRGNLLMNIEPFYLNAGACYTIELAIFPHKGEEDFCRQIKTYPEYIHVDAPQGYVLGKGEQGELTLFSGKKIRSVRVRCGGKNLVCTVEENSVRIPLCWNTFGEKKIEYQIDGRRGEAYFYVSPSLEKLQEKRAQFIVKKQQCLDKNSPLYGAYLIYDNEEKRQYFSYERTDHNANRERLGMSVFLIKYLRKTGDKRVEKSLSLFTEFLLRECLDEDTGRAYNNIGKDKNTTRLYNAPWVFLYFCELYLYNGEERWIRLAYKMIIAYYQNGGTHFYPNGIRFLEIRRAFEKSPLTQEFSEILGYFDEHIENLLKNGTNYPPHEVNYEQTIVTPAACLMLDKYKITKDERYLREAEKHLRLLKKFNGCQPDYRLYQVPIRYWDNYWFGKTRNCVYGDTMPHPALAHSAHVFYTYGKLTGKKDWEEYGLQAWKSGYCLFLANGEASSAYVYPERVNGEKGGFFDPFANEQDGFLYLAYKIQEDI